MNSAIIYSQLKQNQEVFGHLLTGIPSELVLWRPNPNHWCLLEIVCHLYDEEREDFRYRVSSVLEDPIRLFPSIDPVGWVQSRNYLQQDYKEKLNAFLAERNASVQWLQSLQNPQWQNTYQDANLGSMSASSFLTNWLAHDYLHIRQITRLKYQYLQNLTGESVAYAGNW